MPPKKQTAFRKGQSLGEEKLTKGAMASLPCKACHMKIDRGHKEADVRAGCRICHKPVYQKILDSWKGQIAKGRRSVEARLEKLRSKLKQLPSEAGPGPSARAPVYQRANAKLAEAERVIEAIAFDQSGGTHNPPYALRLIQRARKNLEEAENTLSPSASPASGGTLARTRPSGKSGAAPPARRP